jgi:hypothetical protein
MPRQSHKTTLCTLSALHYAIFNPNVKVALVSYRREKTHKFRDYLLQLPYWLNDFTDTKISSDSITLPNGSTIQLFGAKSMPDKFKGWYFNYVIIDDASYISDMLIETCLTQKTKTLILSTRGVSDWFTRIFNDAIEFQNDFVPLTIHLNELGWDKEKISNIRRIMNTESFNKEYQTYEF